MKDFLSLLLTYAFLAAGSIAAIVYLLRRYELSWIWVFFGFALPMLLLPFSRVGAIVSTVYVLATLGAAGRWHFHDKTMGGTSRERAAARLTPLSLRSRRLARRPLECGVLTYQDSMIVGTDKFGLPMRIATNNRQQQHGNGEHTLLVGKTGSGKTVTQAYIAVQSILAGQGAIVVDPKGDRAMRDALKAAAALAGKRFTEWTTDGGSVYNPYKHGSATEIADKALAAEIYTEPHYLRQAQRYLGHQVRAMKKAGVAIDANSMVEFMYKNKLLTLTSSLDTESAEQLRAYVQGLSTRQVDELGGTRDRLAILAESDIGRWLTLKDGDTELDLRDVVDQGDVAYIQLDSDRFPLASGMLGVSVVCDLIAIASSLNRVGQRRRTLVMIDEFAAVAATQVVRLFGRGRSAGFSLVVGTQSLADFRAADETDTLVDQVLDNLSALIIHLQIVPESADRLSQIAGTEETWTTTMQTHAFVGSMPTGDGTKTRDRQFIVHPDTIKELGVGEAVVVALDRDQRPTVTSMFMAERAFATHIARQQAA